MPTAGSLPLLLFGVAAGAIGDLVDWRRFLLVAQGLMLAAAAPPGGCLPGAAEISSRPGTSLGYAWLHTLQ